MYNFNAGQTLNKDKGIGFNDPADDPESLLEDGESFVIRKSDGNGDSYIAYADITAWQSHERVDSYQANPRGKSVDYSTYNDGFGCYSVLELYQFDYSTTRYYTSADVSSYPSQNGVLIRKVENYGSGCINELEYMDFNSIKNFVPENIGDSQLDPSHYPITNESINKYWDDNDGLGRWAFELYGWRGYTGGESLTIYNDGCTYYWPQGDRTDSSPAEWDYVLVKHVDASGN